MSDALLIIFLVILLVAAFIFTVMMYVALYRLAETKREKVWSVILIIAGWFLVYRFGLALLDVIYDLVVG